MGNGQNGERGPKVIPPAEEGAQQHRIHVYYGYGKGKTTCCMGLAVRALGAGRRVAIVQFDKGYDGETEHYSERNVLRGLEGIDLHPTGCERMNPDGSFRFGAEEGDLEEARRGLGIARDLITQGEQELLILDEILAAVTYQLAEPADVMALLDAYDADRRCELVLSGHKVWDELVQRVDLVTEMRKVKHYYAKGTPARLGIEF
ncbi:MAG: cob(I)yrinic acid a,c-diamide adenosyltransferase [Candidatus Latescibacteria bacterium]|jgi:cob(I)alamin adenosyltransferase|nr:cob(I)yrinic acid a,c-diamide adenosyltransferase [Candidatus Latescibacterota bacterium]